MGYSDTHLTLDFTRKAVMLDARAMQLTRKEYELLATLVLNAGEVLTREQLLWQVWNYGDKIRTRTLDVHIRRLRKKLGVYADLYIETIFGVGYRFQPFRSSRPNLSGGSSLAMTA
jgi:DNA-binding response OmpR family regulator